MQGTVKKTESGKKCFLEYNSYNNVEYIKVSIDNVYLAKIREESVYIGNSTTPATEEDLTAFIEKNEFFSTVFYILDGRQSFHSQSGEIKNILTDIFTDKETNDYLSVTQSWKKSDVKDDIKVLKLKGKVGNNDFELRMKTDNSHLVNSYISFYQNLDSFNWDNWDFLEVRINNTVYSLESVAALLKSN